MSDPFTFTPEELAIIDEWAKKRLNQTIRDIIRHQLHALDTQSYGTTGAWRVVPRKDDE